ncbi:putative chromatin regulator PHD family [Helianthus annuus]|nr:putative chromatin regulator PHD family [Helianthus annuus]
MYNVMTEKNTEMDVKELNPKELQHEHPLTLVDLQLMHRDYIEDDDEYDDNDLITTQNFECICNRCDRRIDWYHRYYYKCSMSSCTYSLHKFCEEIPPTLKFQGHPSHTLILKRTTNDKKCCACLKYHRDGICYHCSTCNYGIDQLCATFVEQNTIHHPSHSHPLFSFSAKPGLNECFLCGKKHEGHFYQCTTCFNFLVNSDCLSLPIKLSLHTQQFSHRHLLTLSYSLLDQLYDCECRICGVKLEDEHLIYKCSKCMYYVHPDCATQIKPFMFVLLPVDSGSSSHSKMECRACRVSIAESESYFRCTSCDFYLDCRCALHLPKTIRHKYDKHPLQLSYSPVEDHKSRYFCEVCEEELDPGKWFYHCAECAQSIHSACAPLMLQSEQGANSLYDSEGVYKYINIKFGAIDEFPRLHRHPLSLAPGTENDGLCQECGSKLQSHIILKCLPCNVAFHWYHEHTLASFLFNPSRHIYMYEENKRMIKQRGPQTSLEFYPSEMMRPVTRHWEVVDDDITKV